MGVIIMAAPLTSFAPFAAQAQITSASSACVYGSPASSAPFGCGTCFPPFAGSRCDQTGTTSINGTMSTLSPSNTTVPGSSLKTLIKLTIAMDISAFNNNTFASDVAALMTISTSDVTIYQFYAGSVVVWFYFSDAVTATSPNVASLFLAALNQSNAFTKKYTVTASSTVVGFATPVPVTTTTAPISDGGSDSGLSNGQIAVLIIVIIVIVVIIIIAVVVYVKRSKETPAQNAAGGNPARGQSYGNQDQQMQAIGATQPSSNPQKPGGKPAGAPQPNYGDI
jgi:hypothetical protein